MITDQIEGYWEITKVVIGVRIIQKSHTPVLIFSRFVLYHSTLLEVLGPPNRDASKNYWHTVAPAMSEGAPASIRAYTRRPFG